MSKHNWQECRIPQSGAEGNRTPGLFHAMEALYQLSYSPNKNLYATRQTRRQTIRQLTYEAPTDEWDILIKALDLIKPSSFVIKNVNDNTAVIDQDPLLF